VLKHQPLTLLVAVATLALTVLLYMVVPKGFFPVQDTGVIQGISEAPQSISFAAMSERQQALAKVILQGPGGAKPVVLHRRGRRQRHAQQRPLLINLKPHGERDVTASQVINRLQPQLDRLVGIRLFMQPVQDLTIEDRVSRTQYQFSLSRRTPSCSRSGAASWCRPCSSARSCRRGQRPAGQGPAGVPGDRPRHGQPPGHQRVADHQRAVRRLRPAADLDHLHPGQPVPRGAAVANRASLGPQALEQIHVKATDGGQVRLSALARIEQRQAQLAISHIGQFPAVMMSFNLGPARRWARRCR
jgi:multidrug efflux pump